jgi:hypothetical protein
MFRIRFEVIDEATGQVLTEPVIEGRLGTTGAEVEMICRAQLKVGALLEQIRTQAVVSPPRSSRDEAASPGRE